MEGNFSTTKSDQMIASQIMLMSSMQKYFEYSVVCGCGIPGVEMKGCLEDWQNLVTKTEKLQRVAGQCTLFPWIARLCNKVPAGANCTAPDHTKF